MQDFNADAFVHDLGDAYDALAAVIKKHLGLEGYVSPHQITWDENDVMIHLVEPHKTFKISREVQTVMGQDFVVTVDHGSKGPVGIHVVGT